MPLRLIFIATLALSVGALAYAQSVPPPAGGSYLIAKHAIAGGGQLASGGIYVLTGTVAQSTAGPLPIEASGGSYRLAGGFHTAAATPSPAEIFRNGFEN